MAMANTAAIMTPSPVAACSHRCRCTLPPSDESNDSNNRASTTSTHDNRNNGTHSTAIIVIEIETERVIA